MSILIRFAADRGTLTDEAVDDKSFVGEELLADPEQIFCCLFVDGNVRPNASVDKQKIAAADPRYVLAATERGRRSGSPEIRAAGPRIIPIDASFARVRRAAAASRCSNRQNNLIRFVA
jgi:hypothetical protein